MHDMSFVFFQAAKLATTTAKKTKELGQSVNESVIKPTKEKVVPSFWI